MIEPEDMELIRKVCAELEARFYREPRVSISGVTGLESIIEIRVCKNIYRIEQKKRDESLCEPVPVKPEETFGSENSHVGQEMSLS